MGWQAAGSAPIVLCKVVEKPETVATAIRMGNPSSWKRAEAARDESGGIIDMVTDEEILAAYKMLASTEGVFCEPASAASVAGVLKYKDKLEEKKTIVCVLTGHGLKDPDRAIKQSVKPLKVQADKGEILKIVYQ